MSGQKTMVHIGLDQSVFEFFPKIDPMLRRSTVEFEVRDAPDQLLVGDRFALTISGVWSHSILVKGRSWMGKTLHLDCTSNAPSMMLALMMLKESREVPDTHNHTLPAQEWPE